MNLTKPQKLIYDMEKFAGGAIAVICGSMLVNGKKDLSELKRAVNEIYRLNDALRIRISETDGEVSQSVSDYTEQDINVLCFENKAELDSYAENYAKIPFDFYGDLCDIRIVTLPEQYGLLVKFHHIVGDAWTIALIGTQFNTLVNGESVESYSYTDYVESENTYLTGKRYEKDRAYFLEQFKKCDEVTYLSEKKSESLNACRKTFVIDKDKTKQINDYAQQNATSAFMLFTAALSAYINRTKMNAERFYIGTAVLNRSGTKEKNTMGMFVNSVPMLIELDNSKTFAENLSSVQKTAFSIFRHQKYNYGDVLAAIRKEYGFTEKLYDVMISYQNATITGANIETTWYHSGTQSESLQIHIDDRDNEGIFRIHYDYQTGKFTEYDIDMLHQHICSLLFDAVKHDTKKLYELELLTVDEQQKLLYTFNDTAVDYPRDKCIHQLFEEQVAKTPDNIALKFGDEAFTFAELNGLANGLAAELQNNGVGNGDVVAIISKRSYHIVVAMLAIFKCGAAYLPIDYNYPTDRIDTIANDAGCKVILTYNVDYTADNTIEIPEEITPVAENILCEVNTKDICGIIYTSGSTGTPKGTLLHHQGLVNYTFVNNALYESGSCNIGFAIYTFDAFFLDLIPPMLRGKTAVMATEEEQFNQIAFENLIKNNPECNLFITPAKFKQFVDNRRDMDFFKKIHSICIGGEVFPQEFIGIFSEHTKVYNVYGPTECSMWMLECPVVNEDVTLGKPMGNVQVYILDKNNNVTPIGVTGELCIAGDGVGAGYLNRPELTAEKFIDNPFGKGKLYKTGDLAYWREDGNIVYVGRNDFQVKIRGLRIELGEIENAICGVGGISQAVVVVRKNTEGRQLICAFYTGTETEAKDIRSHIGKKLPKYMLPHICTHLDKMPMTTSGKINRKALPEVDLQNITNDTEFVAPETQMQKELCKLIELVLGTAPVGVTDDFFDLGGDSLKAIEFVSKAHNEGIYFNLQNVFDYPTVKALCEFIENGDKQVVSFADVDFTEVNKVLEKNQVQYITTTQKSNVGNILLAGATGYLGIHVLADYLDNDNGIAYCLVRGKDKADSTKRMQKLLDFYFGNKYTNMNRIEVICADLQKDNFGLIDTEYKELLSKIDTVINCAASVKHYGTYKYFYEVNVESVKNLINFCKKSNAKLIHTSTLTVSGNGFDGNLVETEKSFNESDLYIGQPLENVYAHSKFEAEKAVLEAVADGLHVNIMRMGNLTNRLSDGVFQKNYESNAFLKRIKAMIELGVYPNSLADYEIEFTPIDESAAAVMRIVRNFSNQQTVFHISNPKVIKLETMFKLFNAMGYEINGIPYEDFENHLQIVSKQEGMDHIFETFINDMDENDQLNYDSNIRIENDFTVQYLKMLGFEWSDIGIEYLRKYVEYFKKIGYFR